MTKKIINILLLLFIISSFCYSEAPQLKVSVKTKTYFGKYWRKKHENVAAIWVENKKGNLMKTLKVWGKKESKRLFGWSPKKESVDVVTLPTRKVHDTVEAEWDLVDKNGNVIKPGKYFVCVEMTEENSIGKSKIQKVKVKIKDEAFNLVDNSNEFFEDFTIEYIP